MRNPILCPFNLYFFLVIFLILPCSLGAQEWFTMPENKETRWVSFENSSGTKGQGGRENQGAKGHAFDRVPAGTSLTLAAVRGSGTIRRIWMTFSDRSPEMLRSLRIAMYWDDNEKPAVSVPVGDFFGIGLGKKVPFESAVFSDPEGRSFNCVIPMPFKKNARITLTNESDKDLIALFYDIDLLMEPHASSMLYFHAFWHRMNPTTLGQGFEILPKVSGKGRFLGANIGVRTNNAYGNSWFGEGEIKIYLDEDSDFPTLVGTGTEDYIGTAYGQGSFAHDFQGSPVANSEKGEYAFYRYHIPDPIYFNQSIRVTLQQIGGAMKEEVARLLDEGAILMPVSIHNDDGFNKLMGLPGEKSLKNSEMPDGWTNFYRQDDVSATAYFYLSVPITDLPGLAPVEQRTKNLD